MEEETNSMNEKEFFEQLLQKTKEEFEKSTVKRLHGNKNWSYSICGTPVQRGRGVLLGINWGGGEVPAQKRMPELNEVDILQYNFIKRSKTLLEKYLALNFETFNFNYTNLCFFRTPKETFLGEEDYEISLKLLKKYVEFIKPPWIFSLGNKNDKILSRFGCLTEFKELPDNEGKYKAVTGKLWGCDFFCVPHPNARVKNKSREEIWQNVGKLIPKLK